MMVTGDTGRRSYEVDAKMGDAFTVSGKGEGKKGVHEICRCGAGEFNLAELSETEKLTRPINHLIPKKKKLIDKTV